MEQQGRIIELAQQGKKYPEIKEILATEWGTHSLGRTAIYKWIGEAKCGVTEAVKGKSTGRPYDEGIDPAILRVLNENAFASSCDIAKRIGVSHTTVLYHFEKMGFKFRHSRWIPHKLNDDQKQKRVEEGKLLLNILKDLQQDEWSGLVTGDESIFFLAYPHKGKWCLTDEEPPEAVSNKGSWQKVMVTVIWSINGFHVVDRLPPNRSFNSTYFCEVIMPQIIAKKEFFCSGKNGESFFLHLDNCRVHNSKMANAYYESKKIIRTPHPPYSPDIAPSDFFLFGYIKGKLEGSEFASEDDLLYAIVDVLNGISTEKIKCVFEEWIRRCEAVIAGGGNYIDFKQHT